MTDIMLLNADWAATCAIYNIDLDFNGGGGVEDPIISPEAIRISDKNFVQTVQLELSLPVHDTVLIEGPIPPAPNTNNQQPPPQPQVDPRHKHLRTASANNKPKKRKFRNKVRDPGFVYRFLREQDDTPTVRVVFGYKINPTDDDDPYEKEHGPVSVQIYPVQFPEIWSPFVTDWLEWMNHNANHLLVSQHDEGGTSSFDICQWIEYQSFDFFDVVSKQEQQITNSSCSSSSGPITMVVSLRKQDKEPISEERNIPVYDNLKDTPEAGLWRLSLDAPNQANSQQLQSFLGRSRKDKDYPIRMATINYISSHWKEWVTVECPICFDVMPVANAKEVFPCRHYYCHECISTYAKMIVPELRLQQQNPFTCPIPICRREIKIVQCIKTLLTREEMNKVREWHKNITQPISNMLHVCPRTKNCGARGQMRRVSMDSSIVNCEACGVHWCELCLTKVGTGCSNSVKLGSRRDPYAALDGPQHDLSDCDPSQVLDLCHRYRTTKSERIKKQAEERWPWIREYAVARDEDVEAMQWILATGCTRCPTCNTIIERSEGCFHMCCSQCATHFCYECGDKIFPPFYGTHHCWEIKTFDQFV